MLHAGLIVFSAWSGISLLLALLILTAVVVLSHIDHGLRGLRANREPAMASDRCSHCSMRRGRRIGRSCYIRLIGCRDVAAAESGGLCRAVQAVIS